MAKKKDVSKKLYRSESDKMIAGICGGIAARLGWDPSLVRIGWIFFTLAGGSGIFLYLVLWIVVPVESQVGK